MAVEQRIEAVAERIEAGLGQRIEAVAERRIEAVVELEPAAERTEAGPGIELA